MRKLINILLSPLLALTLSACTSSESPKKNTYLILNQNDFSFMNWQANNTHTAHVVGKIVLNNDPVQGVKVQMNDKRVMTTNQKGEITFSVNRNILGKITINVVSANHAKIKGNLVDNPTKKALLALRKSISVEYPIKIEKVVNNKKDPKLIDVYGRAVLRKGENFPNFTPDKYKVGGSVKDAGGNPVEGATVNLRRDGVEGFSMSTPSDKSGRYTMYYLPEDDENHYFYVHYNGKNYTLPPYKVYNFPDSVSVNIDVTLPKEGTIIVDKPPTLITTTALGALYKGTLIGVNVSKKTEYSISIPNLDGSFVLTLPKADWERKPDFFEVSYSKFLKEERKAGDRIDSAFIPQPKNTEPNHIKAAK